MSTQTVHVFAPATIANLGGGFDVLGVAIDAPGDYVTVTKVEKGKFLFSVQTDLSHFSILNENNIAAFVAKRMLADLNLDFGIQMILHKRMPIGSGMGSSGASCVAAAFAVNALLPHALKKRDLLPYVLAGEEQACGASHGDNVAPSLFGGGCIVRSESTLEVVPFNIHKDITWVVLSPQVSLATSTSRQILPQQVSLKIATRQMGNIAGLVLALEQGNAKLMQSCMRDHIAEPIRKNLIPGLAEVQKAALHSGAIACHISGSGPAMFAVTLTKNQASTIGLSMQAALFHSTGIKSDFYISATNIEGAKIVGSVPHAI